MPIVDPAVEAYAEAHTTPQHEVLSLVAEQTREHLESPGMMVGTLEGRFLEMLVYALGARRVLEVGTFSGYSSISMAAGLPPDGRIVTCEISERHAEFARRHIEAAGLSDRIEVRVGPAIDTIRSLEGPFDFVFIDADKPSYVDYYEACLPLLADGGVLAADNTLWSGRVVDDGDHEEGTEAIRRFNDHVRDDPRVVSVQLTVRDGVTLVRRAPASGEAGAGGAGAGA
jgi:caffeoyl-CoA O-methyltransferase